jgi:hypothetical protein
MDQAAVFLAGSILTMLEFIIVVAGIIVINNLFSNYWKPITWIKYGDLPSRFITREELAEQEQREGK